MVRAFFAREDGRGAEPGQGLVEYALILVLISVVVIGILTLIGQRVDDIFRASFNPLHCGAVVASKTSRRVTRCGVVSIPFIAGQWSLRSPHGGRGANRRRFNPLHCGAVVASSVKWRRGKRRKRFQSPSLRGSGRFPRAPRRREARREFQSPSLRGSGRFSRRLRDRRGLAPPRFNPLHCGAVVASARQRVAPGAACSGFNPLHCGAVVASKSSDRSWKWPPSFNPLHCGAVVASLRHRQRRRRIRHVSIPFIAGQWSLRKNGRGRKRSCAFQSPSLRGSGRFSRQIGAHGRQAAMFQSPSLRGSGRFLGSRVAPRVESLGFNPLHCGAVVASDRRPSSQRFGERSFNPLHCGAVVASCDPRGGMGDAGRFQSPSLRGSGRFVRAPRRRAPSCTGFNPLHCGAVVASRSPQPPRPPYGGRFNPLHCGAVVASPHADLAEARVDAVFQSPSLRGSGRFQWRSPPRRRTRRVSIPFIAGQWSLRGPPRDVLSRGGRFNPLHCGAVVASRRRSPVLGRSSSRFNPLHCGAVVASSSSRAASSAARLFQSPSLRGSGRFRRPRHGPRRRRPDVSIPFIAGQWSLRGARRRVRRRRLVSIPFIAGQWSLPGTA